MTSLFRRIEAKRRENEIKQNLSTQLKMSVEEIVSEYELDGTLGVNETTTSLMTVLEAIFIHGLKETLADKFSMVLADPDSTPQPDFWPLVLIFSHRDIIGQIQKLSQITTDIGRCRSWLRLILNDFLLPSYVESIINQNSALAPYYKKTAYLRDTSSLDSFKKEVHNLAKVTLDLPTNSCLLNYWTNAPLIMVGLRTAPMKPMPVAEGMDIASELGVEPLPIALPPYASSLEEVLYDEEETLKIILGTPIQDSSMENPVSTKEDMSVQTSGLDDDVGLETGVSDLSFKGSPPDESKQLSSSPFATQITEPPKEEEPPVSYDSLVKDYNPEHLTKPAPNYEDLLNRFAIKSEEQTPSSSPSKTALKDDNNIDDISEYEIVAPPHRDSLDVPEFQIMVAHLGKLMQETGLVDQNFMCKICEKLVGINFGPARMCSLTGFYYCEDCFQGSEVVLPARILFNWDFNKQVVSGKAALFLNDIKHHPLLDIRLINPRLYLIVNVMGELQRLRLKLNLLKMYLFTCRVPVIEALKKQLWPREYLYEHVHLYSLTDLLDIPNNNLSNLIKEVIKFCENHVLKCTLCSQKGFICEVCQKPEIIYPFHLETTFRCNRCNNVIHAECKKLVDECPRCFRIKKRYSDD